MKRDVGPCVTQEMKLSFNYVDLAMMMKVAIDHQMLDAHPYSKRSAQDMVDKFMELHPHIVPPGGSRFYHVFCSQCGKEFGPGDNGFSHCTTHQISDGTIQVPE
jgi:hypothetical protein